MALWILSWTTWVSQYQKGKTNLDLLEQEIVTGSGINCNAKQKTKTQKNIFKN